MALSRLVIFIPDAVVAEYDSLADTVVGSRSELMRWALERALPHVRDHVLSVATAGVAPHSSVSVPSGLAVSRPRRRGRPVYSALKRLWRSHLRRATGCSPTAVSVGSFCVLSLGCGVGGGVWRPQPQGTASCPPLPRFVLTRGREAAGLVYATCGVAVVLLCGCSAAASSRRECTARELAGLVHATRGVAVVLLCGCSAAASSRRECTARELAGLVHAMRGVAVVLLCGCSAAASSRRECTARELAGLVHATRGVAVVLLCGCSAAASSRRECTARELAGLVHAMRGVAVVLLCG